MVAVGTGVAVGFLGFGVLVGTGGTGVSVGTGVFVGGTGVFVGGTGVLVGVLVAVGGTGVLVGVLVAVGGTGGAVGVLVGTAVFTMTIGMIGTETGVPRVTVADEVGVETGLLLVSRPVLVNTPGPVPKRTVKAQAAVPPAGMPAKVQVTIWPAAEQFAVLQTGMAVTGKPCMARLSMTVEVALVLPPMLVTRKV